MAEFNHDTIKTKIVAILQANTTDLYTTTGEEGKLNSIEVGYPQGDDLTDADPPYAFVTNSSSSFETITSEGIIVSNAIEALDHTFNYEITVVVNEEDSRTAENKLDGFQKIILDTLEADTTLTGTGTADVDKSFPVRIDKLRTSSDTEGKGFKGRIITLRCFKVTS